MARKASRSASYKPVRVVEVYLWSQRIGAASLDPAYGFYAFAYTAEARASGIEPSPLVMPLREDPYIFTELPEGTYQRLPALLSDALPDDFGNALIDQYMAEKGLARESITALDRLAYMGSRGMGALTFKPTRGPRTQKPTAIELGSLVEVARRAVHGTLDDEHGAEAALRNIIEVGTSAGGARAKAVIAWQPGTGEIVSGQMDAPPGFEHWLLKFDGMGSDRELGASQHHGRIEFAYHRMARAALIDMEDCRLLEENGRAHFMTRRFDRDNSGLRHHLQTLCAMSHIDYRKRGANAYAQLFLAMQGLGLPYGDFEEAFRRMAFNVMARNCDDHAKNFSFRLKQGQPWRLAPAYDLTFAHNPKGEWTHQHLMSVNGKFKGFTRDDLLQEADRFKIGTAAKVLDQVAAAVGRWTEFAQEAQLPPVQIDAIQRQLLPL